MVLVGHLHRTHPTPDSSRPADLRDWPILTLTVSAGRLPWPCSTSSTCTEVFPSRRRRCTLVSRPPLTPAFGVRKSRRASCPSRKKSNLIWPCFRCCQERWAFFLPAVCMENSTAHRLASVSMDNPPCLEPFCYPISQLVISVLYLHSRPPTYL